MSMLPTGTVTFLFTDIEGSTKLAQSHADKWEPARARHHAILQSAIESNNGYVFQIIGDAFCASFHKAGDALKAVTNAQQDLQTEKWGDVPIRVRMGIHTGEAELQEDGQYQGYLALSQVQRIMSAGHGNQTLLSGATENLLRGQLPESIDLLDMGRHNFKGVPLAVRVFQANASGLQRDFPPLRAFDILPNNLPTQLTSFVGREKELTDVKRLLNDTHMLTLIGPGGSGKTRLSIQAANDVLDKYPDGVWLVDLAPILDPLLVPRTTAITIGLRNESQRPIIDMLCDYLSKKKMLIILDNCEHLVNACAQLSNRILHAAAEVKVFASSREALGIAGEVTYRVPSLGLPDLDNLPAVETLSQYEAVKLFIDRATAAIPNFKVTNENAPALAQICHRLDGIPLAIELAAAKIRVLGVEQIAKRLDDRFKLLTSGSRTAMERHQTLRATVDWSYNLLPPEEQRLFKRLAVFRGGWTLEAAEAVCADESGSSSIGNDDVLNLLEHLINKSLVITEDKAGTSRFRFLETIRQYANEKLVDSGELEVLCDNHLEFFLNLAETAKPHLYRHEQLEWLAKLDADYENLRAALEIALGKESAELSLRLCAALEMYWHIRGYWIEGMNWLTKALKKTEDYQNPRELLARIQALCAAAHLADGTDELERMDESAKSALDLAKKIEDKKLITIAEYWSGRHLMRKDEDEKAVLLLEGSYNGFRELDEPYWEAVSFDALGQSLSRSGKIKFNSINEKRLELARKAGERNLLASLLDTQATSLFVLNQPEESLKYAEEADALCSLVGSPNRPLLNLGWYAWLNGDLEQAERLLMQSYDQFNSLGDHNGKSFALYHLGLIALDNGNLQGVEAYINQITSIWEENIPPLSKSRYFTLTSRLFYLRGDVINYKRELIEGIQLIKAMPVLWYKKYFLTENLDPFYIIKPGKTASILGAIHTSEKDPNIVPATPINRRWYEHAEEHTREILGDEAFESAFAEGQRLSLDEALDLVLKSVEEMDE